MSNEALVLISVLVIVLAMHDVFSILVALATGLLTKWSYNWYFPPRVRSKLTQSMSTDDECRIIYPHDCDFS